MKEKAHHKYAWLVPFIFASLMLVYGAFILAVPLPDQGDLDIYFGGRTWDEFATAEPGVASFISLLFRLAGVGYLGFSLFAVVLSLTSFRQGERAAWYAMWILPLAFGLTAVGFFVNGGRPELGIYYGVTCLITIVGLILPYRKFFPKGPDSPKQARMAPAGSQGS